MMKKIGVSCLALLLPSCASLQSTRRVYNSPKEYSDAMALKVQAESSNDKNIMLFNTVESSNKNILCEDLSNKVDSWRPWEFYLAVRELDQQLSRIQKITQKRGTRLVGYLLF
jgi:hypothetical protein